MNGPTRQVERRRRISLKEKMPFDTVVPEREALEQPSQITADSCGSAFHLGGNHPDLHRAHPNASNLPGPAS
jgi:hypothetical protein